MLPSTVSMRWANGRAASAAACARRSFDAATICMALVIFCVALVAAMRTRMSLREAISCQSPSITASLSCPALCRASTSSLRPLRERLRVALDHVLELGGEIVAEVARVADAVEQVAVLRAQRAQQPVLERAHAVDRDRIEV